MVLALAFPNCGIAGLAWVAPALILAVVFAIAGMGAMFAATVRAPVTGIVLTLEMTGNYGQTLPLMVACAASVFTAHLLGGMPIYSMLLERRLDAERAS